MKRLLSFVLFSILFAGLAWAAQGDLHPKPRTLPKQDPFDALKNEAEESAAAKGRSDRMAGELRNAAVADLHQQLPRLIQQARELQDQLGQADLRVKLPADLARRAGELERLARQIHKTVRKL